MVGRFELFSSVDISTTLYMDTNVQDSIYGYSTDSIRSYRLYVLSYIVFY